MAEQLTKETKSIDLLDLLRSELEKRSFHPGESFEINHIMYCDFCNYSREFIDKHGHGETCLLRKRS